MNCKNYEKNVDFCNCTYSSCSRHGVCCECIIYHRKNDELPACYFTPAQERTYNRSISYFVSNNK